MIDINLQSTEIIFVDLVIHCVKNVNLFFSL